MWDVVWTDAKRELVGERRARKSRERASLSLSSPSSGGSALSRFRPRGLMSSSNSSNGTAAAEQPSSLSSTHQGAAPPGPGSHDEGEEHVAAVEPSLSSVSSCSPIQSCDTEVAVTAGAGAASTVSAGTTAAAAASPPSPPAVPLRSPIRDLQRSPSPPPPLPPPPPPPPKSPLRPQPLRPLPLRPHPPAMTKESVLRDLAASSNRQQPWNHEELQRQVEAMTTAPPAAALARLREILSTAPTKSASSTAAATNTSTTSTSTTTTTTSPSTAPAPMLSPSPSMSSSSDHQAMQLEMERLRWMYSTLHSLDTHQAASGPASPPKIPMHKVHNMLALYEPKESASFLAALFPWRRICHLSDKPLPHDALPNVQPLLVSSIDPAAFPIPPELFESVYALSLPPLCSQDDLRAIVTRNVSSCLKPGGTLHLTLIDPLPYADTLGWRLHAWLERHLLLNLDRQSRCLSPCAMLPRWLAEASLRAPGSTRTTVRFFATPDNIRRRRRRDPDPAIERLQADRETRACLRSLVGRMLWRQVWGAFVTTDSWWWDDAAIVEECLELGTFWEYHLIEAVKESR